MTPESPLETVRQASSELSSCLDTLAASPDPAGHRARAINHMSQILRRVDFAVRSASAETVSTQEWNSQIASYMDTLRQIRAKLADVEAALRVRSAQIAGAQTHARTVGAWASLVGRIG